MSLTYLPETHTYLYDGVIVPSVTQIIHRMKPDLYKNIPAAVLKAAAEYGDKVHEAIERAGLGEDPGCPEHSYEGIAVKRFNTLRERHQISVLASEQMVVFKKDDTPLFAGRYDLLCSVNGSTALVDVKTTSKYYADYLGIQLAMYKMALEQEGWEIPKAYCLWLPKKKSGNIIEVTLPEAEEILPHIEEIVDQINAEIQESF